MERITDTLQVINLACCLFIPYFWSLTSSQRSFSDFSYSIPLSPLKKATLDMVSSLPIYKHHSCYWHLVVCDRDPLYRELLATVLLLLWQLHFLPFWYPLKIPLFFTKIKFSLIFILSSYEYISTFFSSLSRLVFLFILILISTGWQITHERMRVFIFLCHWCISLGNFIFLSFSPSS